MKILIIGGGIIGLSCAYYLQQEGCAVSIIDKGDMQDGCSYGNAGLIAPSHFIPLAAPGMVAKGIRWMFDSESPFYIKPRLNRALISWGWKFYSKANKKNVEQSVPVLRDLGQLSKKLYQDWAANESFASSFEEKGMLMLYKTEKAEAEEKSIAAIGNEIGIEARVLDLDGLKKLEPEIKLDVIGAVFFPGDAHLDPGNLLEQLKRDLKDRGVAFFSKNEVQSFDHQSDTIKSVHTNQQKFEVDQIIIAGGSWSAEILKKLQIKLPLQAGKGYSFMLENPKVLPRIPSILTEAKIAVTPMGNHLRFAGTMEISGLDLSINRKRVQGIQKAIPKFLPDYSLAEMSAAKVWGGLRPVTPDGLPYIGRSTKFNNLYVATGHAMLGLSLAPGTGKILSELILQKKPSVALELLRPERYG